MKRKINMLLVVIITFMTLLAMSTIRRMELSLEALLNGDETEENFERPENAGYIFDDYGKGINIQFNDDLQNNK